MKLKKYKWSDYQAYKNTPIYELENTEYFHGAGNPNTIHGQLVRHFTEEEYLEKILTNEGWGEIREDEREEDSF